MGAAGATSGDVKRSARGARGVLRGSRRDKVGTVRACAAFVMLAGCAAVPAIDGGASLDASSDAARGDASVPRDASFDGGPPSPGQVFEGPALLSETGLYADVATEVLAEGVMPYAVRFELWSDGATKRRWLWLPPGTRIDTRDPDRWVFPVGTRAWKEFAIDGARVETRYLVKTEDDRWENVAYVWRSDGSDADARPDGVADALGTTHDVPAIDGCYDCHRGDVDGLNGVGAIQLATGAPDELLARLEAAALLSDPILPRPSIPGTDVEQAALGYLHANCGSCHDAAHPLSRFRAMRMRVPLGLARASDAPALVTALDAEMSHVIDGTTIGVVAGEPEASQLWVRMQQRDGEYQMPSRGTEQVDVEGSEIVRAWIEAARP